MLLAIFVYIIGAIMTFSQHNLQFVDPWFKDKQMYLLIILSYPISFAYYYSWTFFVNASGGSVWSARFVFFGLSYLIYPILTWILLHQTPFTFKNLLCIFLSIVILLIQYKL